MQIHKQSTQFDPSQYISKTLQKSESGAQKRPQSKNKESMCHSSYRFIHIFQVYPLYRHV